MAESSAIRAGRAFVELFADDSKLVRGLRSAEKKIKAFGNSIRDMGLKLVGLGSIMLAPLAGAAKVFADMGSNLQDASDRTGVSVEALSALGYAADLSGAGMESLESALRRMQRTIHDAAGGMKTATDALADLGLTVDDLKNLSPEAQFALLADRLDKIADPTRKAALAMEVFGRSGTQLLPMIKGGSQALAEYRKQAERLGLIIGTMDAAAADAFGDALDDLWKVLKMSTFLIGSALAPTLKAVAGTVIRVALAINGWIGQNKALIVATLKIAAVLVAVGGAIVGLGLSISTIGVAIGGLASALSVAGAAFGALITAITAIFTPIGAAITAVVALGGIILYATDAGGKALDWLGGKFKALSDFASDSFGGIADALAAGDIALAAKILWLSLDVAWQKGIHTLLGMWESLKSGTMAAVYGLWYGVHSAWEIGVASVTEGMTRLHYGILGLWEKLSTGIMNTWDKTINWVSKRLVDLWAMVDDSIDADAVKKQLDVDIERRVQDRGREKDQNLREIASSRDETLKSLDQEHQRNLAAIGQSSLDAMGRMDAESQRRIDASQASLDEARRQWKQAVDEAKQGRASLRDGPDAPDANDLARRARDALAGLDDIGRMIRDEAAKVEVRGTFNAQALWGMASNGDAAERTATATEQTVRFVRRIADNTPSKTLTFE
ncbi:MAG: phage tail tape measure protein [Phycisphaerales bacterium]|nr:phage tail tape measure protein [Phycisphaerales bacterium]